MCMGMAVAAPQKMENMFCFFSLSKPLMLSFGESYSEPLTCACPQSCTASCALNFLTAALSWSHIWMLRRATPFGDFDVMPQLGAALLSPRMVVKSKLWSSLRAMSPKIVTRRSCWWHRLASKDWLAKGAYSDVIYSFNNAIFAALVLQMASLLFCLSLNFNCLL